MNREIAEKVAKAVLYEGYMLYPYRPSAIKNRQRWTFGILYPPAYEEVPRGTERSVMHTECLLQAEEHASVRLELRFLHHSTRQVAKRVNEHFEPVPSLAVDDRLFETWDEAVERSAEFEIVVGAQAEKFNFSFPGSSSTESLHDGTGEVLGHISRRQHKVQGTVSVSAEFIQDRLWKLYIDVENTTAVAHGIPDRNASLPQSLLSAHTVLTVNAGNFVSLLDPPQDLHGAAKACQNIGNFPVLVGAEGERDMLLCSPILLPDYPRIAPESAGDFYDATEMDEMLTLRVMTLTDEEKAEMRLADERARNLLQRTERTAREQLMRTHGTIRGLRPVGEK